MYRSTRAGLRFALASTATVALFMGGFAFRDRHDVDEFGLTSLSALFLMWDLLLLIASFGMSWFSATLGVRILQPERRTSVQHVVIAGVGHATITSLFVGVIAPVIATAVPERALIGSVLGWVALAPFGMMFLISRNAALE